MNACAVADEGYGGYYYIESKKLLWQQNFVGRKLGNAHTTRLIMGHIQYKESL